MAEVALDPHAVWEEIERRGQTYAPMPAERRSPGGRALRLRALRPVVCRPTATGRCPRCGSWVHERKPESITRTWALVTAAIVLYIPANVYPVLTVIQLGAGAQHHNGRRRGAPGFRHVSACSPCVLRQHRGAPC